LTPRGLADASHAGEQLQQLGFAPAATWVSPYLRAQQTANQLQQHLPLGDRAVLDSLVPESSPHAMAELLASCEAERLMLVTHNPFVSALLGLLIEGHTRHSYAMAPASMVLLQGEVLLPGCCELVWLRHAPEFRVSS
jgi:phosphohistidine phosphatase